MNNDPKSLFLGSHCGLSGPEYYLGTVKEALSYNSGSFMFYTGAPQNTKRTPLDQLRIEEGRALIKEAGLDESKIVIHCAYIINLANKENTDIYELGKRFLSQEIKRAAAFHVKSIVFHPGSHLKHGVEYGLESLIEAFDEVLQNDDTDVKIAVETMAGKGSEMGTDFSQIAYLLTHVKRKDKLGVCLDTCHINDAGYDVNDVDGVLSEFDRIIGLDNLLVLHVNDSKNPIGAHKDRHENIGYGHIGFDTLSKYIHHPSLVNVPKILETPYFEGKAPYKKEIEMLSSGVFEPDWRDHL